MSLYRDEAVVLRVQKLGEADRIVTLLTRRNGRVRAVGKGVRRTTSRFGARLEPFSHVDLQLYAGRVAGHRHPGGDPRAVRQGHRRRLRALHGRHRDAGDGRAADRGGAGAGAAAVPAGRRRAAGAGRPARTTRRWCSTRSCCGRWRWPAGRRRWASARGCGAPGRTGPSPCRPAGAVCAGLPAGRRGHPGRAVASTLMVALLSGDWDAADASAAGGPAGGQRAGRRAPAVAPGARAALAAAGRAGCSP